MMAETAYKGYVRKGGKQANARAAKEVFDRDYEGAKTTYETYKRSGDPSSRELSKRIGRGDEEAMRKLDRASRAANQERARESRRGRRD